MSDAVREAARALREADEKIVAVIHDETYPPGVKAANLLIDASRLIRDAALALDRPEKGGAVWAGDDCKSEEERVICRDVIESEIRSIPRRDKGDSK